MASDKVHPMEEGWHAAPLPSAPPACVSSSSAAAADGVATPTTTNSVSIHMPEKMIHTEQEQEKEQSLIPDHPNDHIKQKDYVYSTPVPLPPNHPSHRANRRRRRRPCCCCLASMCATLATIIVLLGVAALVIYLVLKPKAPNFSVTNATVSEFAISASNATSSSSADAVLSLNASVTFTVQAENPNKKIGFYYDEVDVTLYYSDEEIGNGSIPAFYQGHRNTTLLDVAMTGQNVTLTSAIGSTLQSSLKNDSSSIWLEAKAIAHVRIKVGSWKSKDAKVQVDCNVEISNPTDTDVRLLSKSCKFKLKSFKL